MVAPASRRPARGELAHARQRGGRSGLAEDALGARQVAVRGEDLVVGHGLDYAARLIAGAKRLAT